MTDSRLALLAGLFLAPALLLWLGHRMRRHSAVRRAVFWGALAGYGLGMLVTLVAIHYPPVLWAGEGWRTAIVHWAIVGGAVVGAAVGWAVVPRRQGGSTRRWRGQVTQRFWL